MEGWITIQLTEKGELILNEEPRVLENFIKKHIKSEFFFPVYYNSSKNYENKIYLFNGYIFIKYNKEESKNYTKFVNTQYFMGPLLINKRLSLTPDHEIKRLKQELEKMTRPNIRIGDKVRVIDGKYKNLSARVTDFNADTKEADLKVILKCLSIVVPSIPSVCLVIEERPDQEKIPLSDRIKYMVGTSQKGLTREEIINNLEFYEEDTEKISTLLKNLLKNKTLERTVNSHNESIFTLKA